MPEAVWNGFLRLSLVSCPVSLAPATSRASSITLDQLNSRTGNPVAEQFVDSRTGDVVSSDAVVKGYQAATGYVTISDSEIAALSGDLPNVIELAHFAPRDQVDRARFEDSYYIYPDGQLAPDTLEALRLAMQRSGRDALAYVHLGGRERLALIQVHGAGLMLSTLRSPRALAEAEFAQRPESAVPADQIEFAQSLIQRRSLPSDANSMADRYEERLRALIEQKVGGPLPVRPAAAPAPVAPTPQPERAVAPPPPAPEPEPKPEPLPAAVAPPPEPEPEPAPEPQPEPLPEPLPEAEPEIAAADTEPEGSVLAGEPEPPAAEPPPFEAEAAEEATASGAPEAEPEGAVLSGEPEPAAAPPPPEEVAAPIAAAPPPEPEPPAPASADDAARARAERSLFGGPEAAGAREVGTEILLHIMGLGDRRFVEPGWAGNPGSRRQIEAMSIRPREELEPSAIEFRVFAQEGRATAWVSNGNYAGTRGRELPLTGFAVRPAPELRDRFDIIYEGCFFNGGVVGPKRNGEICTSTVANDPLEAVRVTIVART